jgi:thiamine kinase-like enzyme
MAGELSHMRERLESALAPLQGEPRELEGGITNRNFRVTLGGDEYVVRLPGKDTELLGIDRSAELLANEAAAALGIAPAVAAVLDGCLVTAFVTCRALEQGELAAAVEQVARALRAFHDSGVRLPRSFWVPQLLEDYAAIAQARGARLPAGYEVARATAARIAAALPLSGQRPCHNDLLAGNLIRAERDGRILLVDWEYAGMGDPRFDLGNLSVNNGFDAATDERLLRA